jgi:hypothetical protein
MILNEVLVGSVAPLNAFIEIWIAWLRVRLIFRNFSDVNGGCGPLSKVLELASAHSIIREARCLEE